MSGSPFPQGVERLVQAAEMVNQLDHRESEICAAIKALEAELVNVRASRKSNAKTIHELVTRMDCEAQGNFGWEARIVNLMSMTVAQAKLNVRLDREDSK